MTARTTSLLILVALLGCGPAPLVDAAGDESPSSPDATTWPPAPPTPPDETEGMTGEDEGEPPSGFIESPDLGDRFECDLFEQDCPPGDKCAMWANDGGTAYNATHCVPVDLEPDDVGEPCTVEDNPLSGIDSCVLGALCWNVDPETQEGTCIAHCVGSPANPTCADPEQQCTGRDILLCLPTCCPVEQDCPAGQGCYPVGDTFECAPDAGGDSGAYLDPCEFLNICDPGLFCANPDVLPECDGLGCCAPFCALGSTTCTEYDPALACMPWFEEGHAPPVYTHVGACMVME